MAVRLHYLEDGTLSAPTVLLLGSLGSTLAMWEPQLAALGPHFRLIRADTRGHGGSPLPPAPYDIDDLAADALALLDQLEIERCHIVGLSLGGMTALRLAADAPDRVARLVVLCTSARLGPAAGWAERARVTRAHGTAAVAVGVVDRWFTPTFCDRNPGIVDRMVQMVTSIPSEGYAACCGAVERMDLRTELGRITAPLLAIAGADDAATPPAHLGQIVEGVADGRLLVLPDAAHLANVEQPDAVNAAILGHLRG